MREDKINRTHRLKLKKFKRSKTTENQVNERKGIQILHPCIEDEPTTHLSLVIAFDVFSVTGSDNTCPILPRCQDRCVVRANKITSSKAKQVVLTLIESIVTFPVGVRQTETRVR